MTRTVTLILAALDGEPWGALPPFETVMPWWQEVTEPVAAARELHGLDVTILRLLSHGPAQPGGEVSYLAACSSPRPDGLTPVEIDVSDHPLRAPYARPGGPARSLTWARDLIGGFEATQMRTWNLSSIWRLDSVAGAGRVWLKEVPTFFHHEAAVLGWLARHQPGYGPELIGADAGRMLLADVAGEDRYGATAADRAAFLTRHATMQARAASQAGELLELGVPDRRSAPLTARIRAATTQYGPQAGLPDGDLSLLDGLDERLAAVVDCGIPETLVHGDFHPGNLRGGSGDDIVLDWGDSFVGHPGFDALRMTEDVPDPEPILAAWSAAWRAAVPGCEPERALDLLRPVAPLHQAQIYAGFLDRIEPSERGYHEADPASYLDKAAKMLG
ncbi:phosphotransferase family protein [Longispora albida]|uniref:phosphotransferase family protein n=1 Tax=Longispora albida TaxID=203523 RepID=UPI00037229C9|nr:aminoglycoside phosphotransferase family protein [Longispora albida]